MDPSAAGSGPSRRRAEQLLGVAEKLLVARDLEGCKQFSSQALAADPNTPGAEDLNAAASVLLAVERRRLPNGNSDPYAVLGLDSTIPASRHPDAVRAQYSRLSFLLSRSRPDPSFSIAFANAAGHVSEAWRFLSDSISKSALDASLDAAAAAAAAANAARAYHSPAPNRPQSQSLLHARPNPPFATPSPRPTPSPAAPSPWPSPAAPTQRATPLLAVPSPRLTPPQAAHYPRPTPPRTAVAPWQTPPTASPAPRPIPPSVASSPWPQPPPAASPPRPTTSPSASPPRPITAPSASPPRPTAPPATSPPKPTPAPVVSPPRPTPPPTGSQARPTPPAPSAQTPAEAKVTSVASGTPPSSTFWTVCTACRHIHQYDRLYETRKLLCPSCRQTFVAEAMAEPPPIVPGTDMYYCTWGFFPIGFPGCPGFDRLANSQPQGPDQLNAPWLKGIAGVKGNTGDSGVKDNAGDTGVKGNAAGNVENGVPVGAAAEIPIEEVPATTPRAKPMRVKVGAKKRGRPKGSKNKNKL